MPRTELILWRHGETEWNREARFQGQTDVPLNELGVSQARVAAVALAELVPDAIFSSDLIRARRTAEALSEVSGLEVCTDERLREIHVGSWAGKTINEVQEIFPEYQSLIKSHVDFPRSPEGESLRQVGHRTGEALLHIARQNRGRRVVIAGHGNALRVGLAHLLGWDWGTIRGLGLLHNAHWAVADEGSQWRLRAYNCFAPEPQKSSPVSHLW